MKILIADDERDICGAIRDLVLSAGHEAILTYDGVSAVRLCKTRRPDLCLLDVMMPQMNGFDACRAIRRDNPRMPIFMLSAKGDIVDKSVGFGAGADDYLVKPFDVDELLMRIEAGLRRARLDRALMVRDGSRAVVNTGELEIHLKQQYVLKRGAAVNLTPKEFQIVAYLANHLGKVVSAREIVEYVWGSGYTPETTSIAVFIRKIRNKIEDDPSKPQYIKTVWREGYRLGQETE